MSRRIKKRKSISSENKTQEVSAASHSQSSLVPATPSRVEIPRYMNTYRLESKKCFNSSLVYSVMEEVVYKQCFGIKYEPVKCVSKVQTIAGEIMRRLKKFEFDRYRLIVFVQIGLNKNQGLNTSVKCLWDALKDKLVTYNLKSGSMFTCATCFGMKGFEKLVRLAGCATQLRLQCVSSENKTTEAKLPKYNRKYNRKPKLQSFQRKYLIYTTTKLQNYRRSPVTHPSCRPFLTETASAQKIKFVIFRGNDITFSTFLNSP